MHRIVAIRLLQERGEWSEIFKSTKPRVTMWEIFDKPYKNGIVSKRKRDRI